MRQKDPGIADEADDQARLVSGTEEHQLEPADDIVAGLVVKPPEGEELGERLRGLLLLELHLCGGRERRGGAGRRRSRHVRLVPAHGNQLLLHVRICGQSCMYGFKISSCHVPND